MKRVKVSRTEFSFAVSGGYVDGLYQGKEGIFAYVELGQEKEYRQNPKDDANTDYKFFLNCNVYLSTSKADSDKGISVIEHLDVSVIIYC